MYLKQTANTDLKYEHNTMVKFGTETETEKSHLEFLKQMLRNSEIQNIKKRSSSLDDVLTARHSVPIHQQLPPWFQTL